MSMEKFRGNPRHLALLTNAVESGDIASWNALMRKGGSSFKPRLAGANLSGLKMGEIRLNGADLSDADLSGTILSRANLSDARLRGCNLSGSDLSGARLVHTDFSNADLSGADLKGARAYGAVFTGADLKNTRLEDADLSRATLRGAAVAGTSKTQTHRKLKVKVKKDTGGLSEKPVEKDEMQMEGEFSPWIRALDEEERLRQLRKIRELKKADNDKAMLDRRLGRKKPLFKRVK